MWSLLIFLLFPLLFLFFKRILQAQTQAKNLPQGPPGLPIIGNLHQLGALPHQSLWQFSKKYGPVLFIKLGKSFQERGFGHQRFQEVILFLVVETG